MVQNNNFAKSIDESCVCLKAIANKTGIKYPSLCRIYRGEQTLTAIVAQKVSQVINVPTDRLIG